ncbi:MAG TPA: CAP domain-containing protein [Bacillota bacterium]|nr:CAP domain-containing protein [Bacillota bacterium]
MKKIWNRNVLIFLMLCGLWFLAGCPDQPQEKNSNQDNSLNGIEQQVFDQINRYRTSQGLSALVIDDRIVSQARTHSEDMAQGVTAFSHEGFNDRIAATGISYLSAAENIATNQGYDDPATQAVDGWLKSPGHLQNIRGNFNFTGIGVAQNQAGGYYFTQMFMLTTLNSQGDAPSKGWDWSRFKFW